MNKILFYIEKYKVIIILSIIIVILTILCLIKYSNKTIVEKVITKEIKEENSKIKVDIKGMVANSGVYELDNGERVIDVIEKAGGLLDGANTNYLNLSKKLKDGDVIIIYSNDYIESLKKDNTIYIELPCDCPDSINSACIDNIVNEDIIKPSNGLISINNATLEELMTLPGIGESKAIAIIRYREENSGFKTLEDIMNVSGIGEAAYTKIKDHIKL